VGRHHEPLLSRMFGAPTGFPAWGRAQPQPPTPDYQPRHSTSFFIPPYSRSRTTMKYHDPSSPFAGDRRPYGTRQAVAERSGGAFASAEARRHNRYLRGPLWWRPQEA
jgi:hypothetical protein